MSILTVKQLTKSYGEHTVVDRLSFSLQKNQCIALIGPNGAGKTTTLRLITRLIHPTSGSIEYHQENDSTDERHLIGYLPQQPFFYGWMTGEEYLLYCAKLTKIPKKEAHSKVNEMLQLVGLEEAKRKRISTYSGGMKQRLGIAQAIIHEPKLLIMDEPVSALDPIGRREVLTLMEKLKSQMTILFSTHILSDADEVSDQLILLHQGKIVESGPIDILRKKYQTDKIELAFEQEASVYKEEISALQSVIALTEQNKQYQITVSDIESARSEILQLVQQNHWPLVKFNVHLASLEDMFMKVVKQDAMDDDVS